MKSLSCSEELYSKIKILSIDSTMDPNLAKWINSDDLLVILKMDNILTR